MGNPGAKVTNFVEGSVSVAVDPLGCRTACSGVDGTGSHCARGDVSLFRFL